MLWLLLVPAYFLGTFPSAVWIARTKGIDRDQLAEVLAKYIPRIIDELTPQGQLPRR